MDFKDAIIFIQSVGFPVFVATVLLWQYHRTNTDMLKALNALTISIELLRAELKKH